MTFPLFKPYVPTQYDIFHPKGETFLNNKVELVTPAYDGVVNASNHLSLGASHNNSSLDVPVNDGVTLSIVYYSPDTKEFKLITTFPLEYLFLISSIDLDVTFYTLEEPCSQIVPLNVVATDADIAYLNSYPDALLDMQTGRVFHGALSFDETNYQGFYPANDYNSGATVQDLTTGANDITIINYQASCRDTYHDVNYGACDLHFPQDATGRVTAGLPGGTLAVANATKSVDSTFKPDIGRYSIIQTVTGELQDFGPNITVDSGFDDAGSWDTSTGGAFTVVGSQAVCDGSIASRIGQSTVPAVEVGKTYIATIDVAETNGNRLDVLIGTNPVTIDTPVVGSNVTTHVAETSTIGWMAQISTPLNSICKINSFEVKELTTKTQRTEKRLLTHNEAEQGPELLANGDFPTDTTGWNVISAGDSITWVEANRATIVKGTEAGGVNTQSLFGVGRVRVSIYASNITGSPEFGLSTDFVLSDLQLVPLVDGLNVHEFTISSLVNPGQEQMFVASLAADAFTVDIGSVSVRQVTTEDKYYINGIEQDPVPLPDPTKTLKLEETACIGYPDKVDTIDDVFQVHTEVLVP